MMMFFQVNIAPPKHEPVVIHLGADSEDSESEGDSPIKHKSNSFFGGLDSLLKEARYCLFCTICVCENHRNMAASRLLWGPTRRVVRVIKFPADVRRHTYFIPTVEVKQKGSRYSFPRRG